MDPLESRVREYLQLPSYRPIKFAQLAKKIGVRKPQFEAFENLLDRLVHDGVIRFSESGRIESRKRTGGIVGTVRRTAMGDGYITPIASTSPPVKGDIIVFAEDMKDAQDKDEVEVRLTGRRRFGDQQIAVVERVVKRATTSTAGSSASTVASSANRSPSMTRKPVECGAATRLLSICSASPQLVVAGKRY